MNDLKHEAELTRKRKDGFTHTSKESIDDFVFALTHNDKKFLKEYYKKVWDTTCTLSNNPVRNIQNLIIAVCATNQLLARHSGVPTETALTTSDFFIQKTQKMTDLESLKNIYFDLALVYGDLIERYSIPNYTRKTKNVIEYINKHIFSHIKISEIAAYLGANAGYLSESFKKETGITIKDYIHTYKIKESQYLMTCTNLSFTEIATHLGYTDLSHFTRICKKYTGLTPKQLAIKTDKGKGVLNIEYI